jgi:hypothetical protein
MKIRNLLLSATLVTSITMSVMPKANAALALTGSGTIALIATGGFLGYNYDAFSNPNYHFGLAFYGFLVMWCDKDTNQVKFNELNDESAQSLQISQQEQAAYNSEIERINGASEELENTLAQATESNQQEVAKSAYADFKQEISPEAFSALQKVVKASIRQ